ncbi:MULTISPECIES: hypothetical protein [Niallia]|uniref:hypothetical protein n=1 Tax=Niallia TaxID=2837506 RepID=UPI001ED9D2C7|nr:MULTISPECIES: hypothetical protein [Niallia]MED4041050.1 hypothetical protein [Niallia taxi]UPO91139.1 hypothetical protein L8T27_026735 [Niallia sp. Man26]
MDIKKRNIQKLYTDKMQNREENKGKSLLLFCLLALSVLVLLQNNTTKHSLFPFDKDKEYTYYTGEEGEKTTILVVTDLIDKALKGSNPNFLKLSLIYNREISQIVIETSLEIDSEYTSLNSEQIVRIVREIKNNNVLLKEKEIDVVIKSKENNEIFHNLIK